MKEIFLRFKSDTPSFFKKIRKLGIASIALGVTIIGLPAAVAEMGISITLPEAISTIGSYLIVGGIAATKISSLAVTDASSVLTKENKQ